MIHLFKGSKLGEGKSGSGGRLGGCFHSRRLSRVSAGQPRARSSGRELMRMAYATLANCSPTSHGVGSSPCERLCRDAVQRT